MKSPNSKLSVNQLKLAIQLIQNAKEDLKNDKRVRDAYLHDSLTEITDRLDRIGDRLVELGYPKPRG